MKSIKKNSATILQRYIVFIAIICMLIGTLAGCGNNNNLTGSRWELVSILVHGGETQLSNSEFRQVVAAMGRISFEFIDGDQVRVVWGRDRFSPYPARYEMNGNRITIFGDDWDINLVRDGNYIHYVHPPESHAPGNVLIFGRQ